MILSFISRDASDHVGMPLKDTWVTEPGARADLLRGEDYPITAECQICTNPIRLERKLQMEWRHLTAGSRSRPR
jgi:hypothetical protein